MQALYLATLRGISLSPRSFSRRYAPAATKTFCVGDCHASDIH